MKKLTLKFNYTTSFWILLVSITLFRLVIAGKVGLSTDESHYVLYTRFLDWGYFDHPPFIAFMGALSSFFGESPIFYRVIPIFLWSLTVLILRALVFLVISVLQKR